MTPMTVALTDTYGWRIRNYACCAILLFVAFPAVLLWTQPLEGLRFHKKHTFNLESPQMAANMPLFPEKSSYLPKNDINLPKISTNTQKFILYT